VDDLARGFLLELVVIGLDWIGFVSKRLVGTLLTDIFMV